MEVINIIKKLNRQIIGINDKINKLSKEINTKLNFNIKKPALKLLQLSTTNFEIDGLMDYYIDFLHYIENCSDEEYYEFENNTSSDVIANNLYEIRCLRKERRELKYEKEKKIIFIKGNNLSENYNNFTKYKINNTYYYKTNEYSMMSKNINISEIELFKSEKFYVIKNLTTNKLASKKVYNSHHANLAYKSFIGKSKDKFLIKEITI